MRILVVEDERKIAQAIKKGLEQESYAADVAFSLDEARDLVSSDEYDLVLLDRRLPDGEGSVLCSELRKNGFDKPIIMLTAMGQIHDKVTGLDSGADDYITKPFSFEELLARIRAVIRRPSTWQGNVLKVGELELDPIGFGVKQRGIVVSLSAREFGLLEFLMRHPNQVLSKERIIAHVWNMDADILPNTVEVYMKNLRGKIGQSNIVTVRGFGYKLLGD